MAWKAIFCSLVPSRGSSVEGVTDDMIAEFSRQPGETTAYAARPCVYS